MASLSSFKISLITNFLTNIAYEQENLQITASNNLQLQNPIHLTFPLLMDHYYSRIQLDLELTTRLAQEKQLELRRSRRVQQALDRQEELRRLATADKIRADRDYEEYLLRRQAQQKQLEAEYARQRVIRQEHLLEQQRLMDAERRARVLREEEADRQRLILLTEEKKRAELLEASRRVQLDTKLKIQDEITRQNIRVKEQQLEQQKLQAELKAIDIEIGTIYDQRQNRRKAELLELQGLDEKIFKVKQDMRASKIRQTALEDSLNNLSKIIVPGAR